MGMTTKLDSDNIRGLVLGLALPSMAAQFVSVLYSIVDRMYIGNIPQIGETALAGVGICGPIVTLITAFASMVGIGGGPLVSIRLGAKREAEAERIMSNCFWFLGAIAVAVMIISLLLKEKLLWWFGASEAIFPYANEYLTIYLAGTLFALLSTGMNQFIICQGYSKTAMCSVLIGAAANIILDPVFIFALNMKVAGAALATILSQLLSCIFVLSFLFGRHSALKIRFIRPELKIIKNVFLVGLTPFLIIAFDNVMLISLNAMLTKYGGPDGDMLLTCNTILQSFMLIITMPLGGITGGTQTILGFNYGARRPDKIMRAQKWILAVSFLFSLCMFLIAQTVPQYFIRIFTREPAYVEMTAHIIRLYTIGVPLLAVQYTIVDGFTGMGVFKYAFALSAWRKVLYFACVFTIPLIFSAEEIFYCEPVSDILGPCVSVILYITLGRKMLSRL
ncbi:MAG: MATE family efflux transporter [Eubacteriales bacterium]|nr:MATE family efflux transporter [Eubacteriales bacterium]